MVWEDANNRTGIPTYFSQKINNHTHTVTLTANKRNCLIPRQPSADATQQFRTVCWTECDRVVVITETELILAFIC